MRVRLLHTTYAWMFISGSRMSLRQMEGKRRACVACFQLSKLSMT